MTAPTEMEQRVADVLRLWIGPKNIQESHSIKLARVAIRAMREPTEDMRKDGGAHISDPNFEYETRATEVWTAMIDAASPPKA